MTGNPVAEVVRLPGGLWHDGHCHTRATVRPVVGFDEEALVDATVASMAERATTLLARCVTIDGLTDELTPAQIAAALSIGDREHLIWHVRRLTRGETVDAIVNCGACDEKLDVSITVDQLLHPPYEQWPEQHTATLAGHEVVFIVPTGAMQHSVASLATIDADAAGTQLLRSCIVTIDGADIAELAEVEAPTDELAERLMDQLAEVDPQAEALFDISCPHCRATTMSVLDAAGHFLEELQQGSHFLYHEVHTLAWYYHWSEHDILALDPRKRRRYLELIDQSTGGSLF